MIPNVHYSHLGQLPPQEILTIKECVQQNDYVAAYRRIFLLNENVQHKKYQQLLLTIAEDDLFHEVENIYHSLVPQDAYNFLFDISNKYLEIDNLPRIYEIYELLFSKPKNDADPEPEKLGDSWKRSLATKIVVARNAERNQIIKTLVDIHQRNRDVPGAIELTDHLPMKDAEELLFQLGSDLDAQGRAGDATLVLEALKRNYKAKEGGLQQLRMSLAGFIRV